MSPVSRLPSRRLSTPSERRGVRDSRRRGDCSGDGRSREGREGLGRRELLEYLHPDGVISAAPRETRRKGCKRTL